MTLPLKPPLLPQLAKSASALPSGDAWAYEPKWDGFRALAFVDTPDGAFGAPMGTGGGRVYLQSRNGKDLTRYFPEIAFPPGRYVLDGELVASSFDTLGQRIHPAASRVERLAAETPATFVAFDLLAEDDEVLLGLAFLERRARLEALELGAARLTPMVRTPGEAERWLHEEEGVIAKQTTAAYRPGERVGMVKVKRVRTIDAVVLGWRPGKEEDTVGSIILGLYDQQGRLREVGHSSGFKAAEKRELVRTLGPYETGERGTGEPSRWNNARDLAWVKLRPELVVEVTFDHVSDGRIRHGAKVQRWRADKPPGECTLDQLA